MKKQLLTICLIFSAVFGLFAQADIQPLATVKITKSETITLKQLKKRCDVYKLQYGVTSFTVDQKKQILDSLIAERLVVQAASKAGINLTDTQVQEIYLNFLSNQVGQAITEQQYASLVKEQTGFSLDDYFQAQMGMNTSELKTFLKNQYISQQYIYALKKADIEGVTATDAEIREYYEMNKQQFFQPDILKVFLVIYPSTVANSLKKTTELRDSFKAKAPNFEELKVKSKAGTIEYQAGDMYISKNATAATQLGIDYQELLKYFKLGKGDLSEIQSSTSDNSFFYVRDIYPSKVLALSDVIQPDSTITVYEYVRDSISYQKQTAYFTEVATSVTESLMVPENYQMVKKGADLDKLFENW